MAHARLNTRKFRELRRRIEQNALRPVYQSWGSRYLTWTKRLFKKNAAGGGEWPALKSITYQRATGSAFYMARTGKKRSRASRANLKSKYQAAKSRVKILIDTGTLFGALSIGQPGNLYKILHQGIRVGFAGVAHGKEGATIKEIAIKHQKGDSSSNLPARKILHEPNKELIQRMMQDLKRGVQRLGRTL